MTTMYESGSPYIMTGADIVRMGEPAEMLVGGKNYNTALISRVEGIRTPQFRAIPATAFQLVLDQSRVNAALIYQVVDAAMADVCTGGNPRPCTWEEVLGVYKTAFGK